MRWLSVIGFGKPACRRQVPIELAKEYNRYKHVSLMGATPGQWGTAGMQLPFLPVFNTLKMLHINKFEIFVSQAHKKFDADGNTKYNFITGQCVLAEIMCDGPM